MFSTFKYRQYSVSLYENKLADGSRFMACFRCACCIVRSLGGNLNVNKPERLYAFLFPNETFLFDFCGTRISITKVNIEGELYTLNINAEKE